MEELSFVMFILSILGFVLSNDYVSHIWGAMFLNTSLVLYLGAQTTGGASPLTETQVIYIYIVLNLMILCGIFVLQITTDKDNVDEIGK